METPELILTRGHWIGATEAVLRASPLNQDRRNAATGTDGIFARDKAYAVKASVTAAPRRAVESEHEAYRPAERLTQNTDVPAACFPLLEFLDTCRRSRKPPVEEQEIPENLRLGDVVVCCKAQDLISIERTADSLEGSGKSFYRITDHGLATVAGHRLRIDENKCGWACSDRTIREQSDPPQEAKKDGPTSPSAKAAEAVAHLRDDWATINQLCAVTGKTPSAIRSAFFRAKRAGEFLPGDELKIPDTGPSQPRKRYRVKGVWRHIFPTSSACLRTS